MKILLLLPILLLIGCASTTQVRFAEWEQAYKDKKLTYYELESLKNQERLRKETGNGDYKVDFKPYVFQK